MALPCPTPSTALFTSADLDEIGCSALKLDRPLEVVAELVDAVNQGRVVDQTDTGYALLLAAEITEHTGDVPAAAALAARAVAEERRHGESDGYARAYHARLLLQLGREDEGQATPPLRTRPDLEQLLLDWSATPSDTAATRPIPPCIRTTRGT